MSKHTPGPWTWGESYNGLYGSGKDNEVLRFAPYEGMYLDWGSKSRDANARLIAAAPELLEALKLARSIIGHPDDAHSKLIDAAIKKAEGTRDFGTDGIYWF